MNKLMSAGPFFLAVAKEAMEDEHDSVPMLMQMCFLNWNRRCE